MEGSGKRMKKYFTTYYSHTYQLYKKNVIKIDRAVSEKFDDEHSNTRFSYIRWYKQIIIFLCLIT